jgi:hypothetical protein
VLGEYAKVVLNPAEADVALVRLNAPYEPRPGGFEAHFHAGSLEFPVEDVHRLQALFSTVPTVVDLYLDRPAIVPEIVVGAAALLISYGSSGRAFTDSSSDTRRPRGGCHSTYRPPHVRSRTADPTCRSTPLIRYSASATASVGIHCRGMTVSTRARWVRNSSMKLRRKSAVASLVTSPSSVKTSGEYWM